MAIASLAIVPAALAMGNRDPELRFTRGTPADVRALAADAWDHFLDTFDAHRDCIPSLTLGVAWSADDRGAYRAEESSVTIRVPGTAGNLRATLFHELGHHLEATCPAQRAMRASFLQATGLPGDSAWFGGTSWEATPSERFAETVSYLLLGSPPPHIQLHVSDEELAVVRAWARG